MTNRAERRASPRTGCGAHFYAMEGRLVRRWVPAQRRMTLEIWTGAGWAPFPDVDRVLRFGHRLREAEAVALLRQSPVPVGEFTPLGEDEARKALTDRLRRG